MTGSNNTTSQTNNPSGNGTGTTVERLLDILSGRAKPTVEFETSISRTSILTLAGAVLFVGLLLIYASKKA